MPKGLTEYVSDFFCFELPLYGFKLHNHKSEAWFMKPSLAESFQLKSYVQL